MRIAWPSTSGTRDIGFHPLLRGPITRGAWRLAAERLTPAGRGFLAATLLFAHFTICSLDIQSYLALSYAVGLWTVAFVAARLWRPRVRLQARHAERVCAGEVLPVELRVVHAGLMPAAELRAVPHRLPPSTDPVPEAGVGLPVLRRGETARVRMGIRCNRRGVYRTRGFRVETSAPFGLLHAARVLAEERPLLVYPRFTRLARLEIATGRRFHPGGVALASSLGDTLEFLGNREYREGDNVRDIDWRATARLQRPIVREYREEYFLRVAVILDTHVPRKAPEERREEFERAVSLCAAVGDYMAREEYIVDLFAAGPNLYHLTAGRSLAYLDQILDILACVEESPAEPFAEIEPELHENLAQITTVVCVFLDWNEPRRAFVRRLREHGAAVKVVVVRDAPCTLDPAADADSLGEIPVIDRDLFDGGVEAL